MSASKRTLSIVIPIYNEEGSIALLFAELSATLKKLPYEHEVIFVNDGSSDGSLAVLKKLSGISIIELRRNYGQATALDAGFKAATGDIVVSMDGDGQNVPADIPRLIEKLEKDKLDVVAGWRRERHDASSVLFLTRTGRMLRRLFINDPVHDTGCTLRAYRSEAVKSLDIGGEMHRYILALLRWKGFTVGELVVEHRPRQAGISKYGTGKALRGFIDLMYIWFIHKYSQRPLHFFGYLSFASFVCSGIALLWTLYRIVILTGTFERNELPLFMLCFFLICGVLFFSLGIIIDLLIRLQLNASPYERRYYVREIIKT